VRHKAPSLFRLPIHFLPKCFFRFCSHLFADDLVILLKGALERKLSQNIIELEEQAKIAMCALLTFSENHLLPVNVKKTNAMLIRSRKVSSTQKLEISSSLTTHVFLNKWCQTIKYPAKRFSSITEKNYFEPASTVPKIEHLDYEPRTIIPKTEQLYSLLRITLPGSRYLFSYERKPFQNIY
jgi:hypothetical protein